MLKLLLGFLAWVAGGTAVYFFIPWHWALVIYALVTLLAYLFFSAWGPSSLNDRAGTKDKYN